MPALVATWYIAAAGADLFCGGTYDTSETWVALPYGGEWECGDLIAVWFVEERVLLLAEVRDTGPFGKHCVLQENGLCVSIGVDVPKHAYPVKGVLSAKVVLCNLTATAKARRVGVQ